MSTTVEETEKTETAEETKNELLLDSLEIKGYRCFEHLTIEKLGRVNLIVGKNNVGKTALLEALWILANRGDRKILNEILDKRYELPLSVSYDSYARNQDGVGHLFFGRPRFNESSKNSFFKVGLFNNPDLYIKVERVSYQTTYTIYKTLFRPPTFYIETNGVHNTEIIKFWDKIALTEKKNYVINSLQIILEKISDIDLLVYPEGATERIPLARTIDSSGRIPLKSLGEGMSRVFGIILALVNCQDGIIFIDEIEIGLHYSVLPDVWKLIFKTAKDLNVQVFATTHSKDCVEAFAQIANENDEKDDGMLIRLERHDEKIVAKTINEENLGLAIDYGAEVR
ncbi:MAG TPA: AAA family ATPase [Pyrinomonadaceae bacterium]|nr:AAA family ATPase [Pyrinomonadaceae bacterium]